MKMFFELIQISLGNKDRFERLPTKEEWPVLFDLACKQSIESVLLEGVNRLENLNANVNANPNLNANVNANPNVNVNPNLNLNVNLDLNPDDDLNLDLNLQLEWIGAGLQTENMNKVQNERAKELTELFAKNGFRSCVLKGQGTALYYDKPERRQCGDIDIWVTEDEVFRVHGEGVKDIERAKRQSRVQGSADDVRCEVLRFVKEKGFHIGHVDIKHSDIKFFEDVPVEVHFLPSWMYCPATNKRLQKFFQEKKERQFANIDEELGFAHTTIDFDLVYSMVHIYRHIFSEGIGLRQLVDYYYILQHSTEEQRKDAFNVLCQLKMKSFAGGIIWILSECFGMNIKYSLCPANEKHGSFLLSEIMTAGSFGHFDDRIKQIDHNKKFKRGFSQLKRNLRFVTYYPSEVLWSPFWKLWHWGWRKRKGYL